MFVWLRSGLYEIAINWVIVLSRKASSLAIRSGSVALSKRLPMRKRFFRKAVICSLIERLPSWHDDIPRAIGTMLTFSTRCWRLRRSRFGTSAIPSRNRRLRFSSLVMFMGFSTSVSVTPRLNVTRGNISTR